MKICVLALFIITFGFVTETFAQNTGKVINVIDGNTIEVVDEKSQIQKLMFAGIDCPEPGQEYADKAKKFIEKLLLNKEVSWEIVGKDRWANYLAVIKLKDDLDPRVELLKEGLAWTHEKNPLPELEVHRVKAQEKRKGLWKEESPVSPWIYRRQQSMMQAKSS
jgi:endonuclease YncB( thermonuclease family)